MPSSRRRSKGFQQFRVVALMQANARLIQNIQYAHQPGTDLRGKPNPLRFPARQCRRRAVKGEIVQPDIEQEPDPRPQLLHNLPPDKFLPRRQRHFIEERAQLFQRHRAELGDIRFANRDGERFGLQALCPLQTGQGR